MVPPRCQSKGSVHTVRRVYSPIQTQTSSSERTSDNQWLCKPSQEPLPEGSFACPDSQKGSREGKGSNFSSLFQHIVYCPQTKSKWRPILDLCVLNKFLSVQKKKQGKPQRQFESPYNKENGWHRWISVTPISTFQYTTGPGNSYGSTSKTKHTSSGLFPLASQQLLWSSLVWSKRSS